MTITEEAEAGENLYLAGFIAYKGVDYQANFTNCYNSGNLVCKARSGFSTAGIAETAYNPKYIVAIGSLIGQTRLDPSTKANYNKLTGTFVNTGNIEYSGTNESGPVYVGGIIGKNDMPTTSTYWAGTVYNLGDVISTGTAKTEHYVGGIFGCTNSSVQNCVVYGKVSGQGSNNIGMIMGSARAEGSVVATNCQVGGTIVGAVYDPEDKAYIYNNETLDANNYFNYIYGSGENTDWGTSSDYDTCTLLESKPTIE